MPKILRQNVGDIDYTMVGCALSGSCATAASDFVKVVTLSDGDTVSDGMTIVVAFTNGNTAGNAPIPMTIYSSDQVHYFSDSGLTQPFTLAPSGCYTITYTGTGNAYDYISYPVLQVGSVSGPLCDASGKEASGSLWLAGDKVSINYANGCFSVIPQTTSFLAVMAASSVVNGAPVHVGGTLRILFTQDLAGSANAGLVLTYNGADVPVMVGKNGSLSALLPFDVGGGTYKYLQAYTTFELMYDGAQFIIIGNPVVLSGTDYTIYADGLQRVNTVAVDNKGMVTSGGVASAINSLDVSSVGGSGKYISAISETDGKISATAGDITSSVSSGNSQPVTSGGVAEAKYTYIFSKDLSVSGWYKIATFSRRNIGSSISIELGTGYYYKLSSSHKIQINHGWAKSNVFDFAQDEQTVFDKIRICWNLNDTDYMGIYVHYTPNVQNPVYLNINACTERFIPVNFETDSLTWQKTVEHNLGSSGLYINGQSYNLLDSLTIGSLQPVTSNAVRRYAVRIFGNAFTNYFTANTTVSVIDFVNAVVDRYGEGVIDLEFTWSNANQGYITDGITNILMNGNFIRGFFQYFKTGYNWKRGQFFTYDINTTKSYMIDISRASESSTAVAHIYPLN